MATFPTLTPSSRTFTPGRHPHSEISTLNGLQVRVMTSNVIIEQQLRLTFIGLTESEMLSIRSHYIGQQGRFLSFFIPSSLLSGMTTPSYFTPTGYSWIYGSAPQVEDIPGTQRYTVSVELVTIPPEGANVNGAEFTVSVSLAAGIASVSGDATGADLTVTASIEGGVVADNSSAGLDLTVSVTLAAGTATGGAPSLAIGDAYQGGFFAGYISHTANGVATHALIVAPMATGSANKQWKTTATGTTGTSSTFDGAANSANMNNASHPAAEFCEGLTIGGYSDWYLPALDELDIAYENLKPDTTSNSTSFGINSYSVPKRTATRSAGTPARTSLADFQSGGAEAFAASTYWSSSEYTTVTRAWHMAFTDGIQSFAPSSNKTGTRAVRAFRKVAV